MAPPIKHSRKQAAFSMITPFTQKDMVDPNKRHYTYEEFLQAFSGPADEME